MTKIEAIKYCKDQGCEVLTCRMHYNKPKVTIHWKDYLKIRDIINYDKMNICLK